MIICNYSGSQFQVHGSRLECPACALHADRQLARELTQNYEERKTTNRDHKIPKITDQKKSGTSVNATLNREPGNLSSCDNLI